MKCLIVGHGKAHLSECTHSENGISTGNFGQEEYSPAPRRRAAQREALASATVIAVMLTIRPTVAEGVRVWTGVA